MCVFVRTIDSKWQSEAGRPSQPKNCLLIKIRIVSCKRRLDILMLALSRDALKVQIKSRISQTKGFWTSFKQDREKATRQFKCVWNEMLNEFDSVWLGSYQFERTFVQGLTFTPLHLQLSLTDFLFQYNRKIIKRKVSLFYKLTSYKQTSFRWH